MKFQTRMTISNFQFISSTQLDSYGVLYGDFLLETTGDKTYGISLTNSIFITVQGFSGEFLITFSLAYFHSFFATNEKTPDIQSNFSAMQRKSKI